MNASSCPKQVLFACTLNTVRSVMAEAVFNARFGALSKAQSCGVMGRLADGFALAVLTERGLPVKEEEPRIFTSFSADDFDQVITLSAQAAEAARIWLGANGQHKHHYWHITEPSGLEVPRAQKLAEYRLICDEIETKLDSHFSSFVKKT